MSQYADARGCRIRYQVDGPTDAPPLLLINGIGLTMELWKRQVPVLSREWRLIRYNARGHLGSDVPDGDYTLEQLGRDALSVLDAAGVPAAHVCGLSLGGMTAMWLGVHAAGRVNSLVLANTAARIGSLQSWNERIAMVHGPGMGAVADMAMLRWFTEGFRTREPATIELFRTMVASSPPVGYLGCCAALREADLRDAVHGIRVPTLVIGAREDQLTPIAAAEFMRDTIPGASLEVFDCSHLSNVEESERFTDAVAKFFGRS